MLNKLLNTILSIDTEYSNIEEPIGFSKELEKEIKTKLKKLYNKYNSDIKMDIHFINKVKDPNIIFNIWRDIIVENNIIYRNKLLDIVKLDSLHIDIITHNSKAHIDEIIAIAILVRFFKYTVKNFTYTITRKNKIEDIEIKDPRIFVIDTGLDFDDYIHVYDHHHIDENIAAVDLIRGHYMSDIESRSILGRVINRINIQDTQGIRALKEKYNISIKNLDELMFIEKGITDLFIKDQYRVIELLVDLLDNSITRTIKNEYYKDIILKSIESGRAKLIDNGKYKVLDLRNIEIIEDDINNIISAQKSIIMKYNIDYIVRIDTDNTLRIYRSYNGKVKGLSISKDIPEELKKYVISIHKDDFIATIEINKESLKLIDKFIYNK